MICTKCKKEKEDSEFSFRNKDKNIKHSVCNTCQREYKNKHYKNNREAHYKRNNDKKNKIKALINEIKKEGCTICGEKETVCLDFHHLDSNTKEYNVSTLLNFTSYTKIIKEINKCVLVCSNCHRKIHAGLITPVLKNYNFHLKTNRFEISLVKKEV